MKKKFIIGISIIIFILFILITATFIIAPFIASSDTRKANIIKTAIKKANYCNTDSDCIDMDSVYPFNCHIYVNKNEANQISELFKSLNVKCAYDCAHTVFCENNKCKKVCK